MTAADHSEANPVLGQDALQRMTKYGVIQIPVDTFHVGGYRYTNLEDAIAQAERQQRPG